MRKTIAIGLADGDNERKSRSNSKVGNTSDAFVSRMSGLDGLKNLENDLIRKSMTPGGTDQGYATMNVRGSGGLKT